jgi:hypothetical protein
MIRKKWEGEAWPCVIVWHFYGFIVTVPLHLSIQRESLLSEHSVQEAP